MNLAMASNIFRISPLNLTLTQGRADKDSLMVTQDGEGILGPAKSLFRLQHSCIANQ